MMSGLLINRGLPIPPLGVAIYFNIPVIIVLALCLGLLVGAFNGLLITRFNVAPFIATLGTLYVARGTAQLSNNGATFPNLVGNPELGNTGFPILGAGSVLGIPIVIWIMVVFAAVAAFVAGKMPFGRQVYAVGGNERAAELSGIYVNRIKMAVYMICGLCAAMTGLITASQLVAAHPGVGESYELNAIAAVVLGGTSLSGGRGTMWGTIVGALVIGVLTNGLVLLGVQEFWKKVITGLVIILAVVLDQLQERLQQRLALKRA
jgi:erythritol transport system permease protein